MAGARGAAGSALRATCDVAGDSDYRGAGDRAGVVIQTRLVLCMRQGTVIRTRDMGTGSREGCWPQVHAADI